jgi:HPt (histidine-containing phosphotransfer) domain-containing protein
VRYPKFVEQNPCVGKPDLGSAGYLAGDGRGAPKAARENGVHKSTQIFDVGHLAAQTGNDHALQCEILALFVRQSREILALLQDDVSSSRVRADLAHKLKGSARTVGAFSVAKAAEVVETSLRAGDATPQALGDLGAAADAACTGIDRYLASLSHRDRSRIAAPQHKS